jgi:putative ABC transport system permease protein
VSLALATLIYEWRRYLAAVVALAFSGLLVLGTTGLFTGIVHSVLATTERSRHLHPDVQRAAVDR